MDDELPPMRALALTGPTAVGKSAVAMQIARQHPLEIISVDSALVYRGMDIGTAKPGAGDQTQVPHHLIDIRDPLQAYSAADFVRDAARLVGEINQRGKLALLVGGTMLYLRALMQGLDELPRADAALRLKITHDAARLGWPALHARLAEVDPQTAARLAPADSQRIQRALEVHAVSGQPISSLQRRAAGFGAALRFANLPMVSLEPEQRDWLHRRIALRFDAMLAGGLIDELRALRARGDLHAELPSMRCVGYRQVWQALEHNESTDQLREKALAATRQLAKRQLTWLRAMPARRVVACDAPHAAALVLARVDDLVRTPP